MPANPSPPTRIHRRDTRWALLTPTFWKELPERKRIDRVCRGYSGRFHWLFFRRLLREEGIRKALVLGVYYGRDLSYLRRLSQLLDRPLAIQGVDRFEDSACDDWPEEKRGLNWEEAGFGPPPALERARGNLRALGLDEGVALQQGDALEFMRTTSERYDFIYIDIAHDYETTKQAVELALPLLTPGGMLGGDDFSDQGTWGVKSAVLELFREIELQDGWIWLARPEHAVKR